MAISSYEKNGKIYWKVYLNFRNKNEPGIRAQRTVTGLVSEKAALLEEKKLIKELTESIFAKSSEGNTWDTVIGKWELAMRERSTFYKYSHETILDNVNIVRNWTRTWLKKPASTIGIADARDLFFELEHLGRSLKYRKNVKSAINVIYKWGIEERLIPNVHQTPVHGLILKRDTEEKVPDILTTEEIKKLLFEAKKLDHPWYPIWATAILTGMRNGELHALLWSDVDLENRSITVSKSYHSKRRVLKSTKSGKWRKVPISDELYSLFLELKLKNYKGNFVLPRFWEWDLGIQASVLRMFCESIGIRSVKFHALRACFATQLLAHDIAPARIMKICGWTNLKTMQHYVRLAGVDEKGATQVLKVLPSDQSVMGELVSILDLKSKK